MIEQVKFTYSPLEMALEKQTKTIEDPKRKKVEALKGLKPDAQSLKINNAVPEGQLLKESKNEIERINPNQSGFS